MNNTLAGYCGKCGAPYYVPTVWHGVIPPQPQPTCNCWNTGQSVTTDFSEATMNIKNQEPPEPTELELLRMENEVLKEQLEKERERYAIIEKGFVKYAPIEIVRGYLRALKTQNQSKDEF